MAERKPLVLLDTNLFGELPAGDTVAGRSTVQTQIFTSDGTWYKPVAAQKVHVLCIGGGGGGGAGRKGAAGTVRTGGSGGGGGGRTEMWLLASDLASTVAVEVGLGGAGGASVTTDNTNGSDGVYSPQTGSGASMFGLHVRAWPGNPGSGGRTVALGGGTAGDGLMSTGSDGGTQGASGAAGNGASWSRMGAGGGGAGGGLTTANAASNGGSTINYLDFGGAFPASIGAAGGTAPGGNGSDGATVYGSLYAGYGGSGGASHASGNAGHGGNGGNYGAGGGGGGASTNGAGQASGAGGNGAPGIVIVTTWCTLAVPVNTVAPVVSGGPSVGATLSCTTGTWANAPTSYSYQWEADTGSGYTDLVGETANTLDTTGMSNGDDVRCKVTATNIDGDSLPETSNAITLSSGTLRTFGYNPGVGPSDGSPAAGDRAWAAKYNKSHSGTVTGIFVWFGADSTAGNYKVCAHAAGGADPGALLWSTPSQAVPSGGGLVEFDLPVSGLSGTDAAGDYWLVAVSDGSGAPTLGGTTGSELGVDSCMANGTYSFSSPPSSWPGTDANYNVKYDMYCEYIG